MLIWSFICRQALTLFDMIFPKQLFALAAVCSKNFFRKNKYHMKENQATFDIEYFRSARKILPIQEYEVLEATPNHLASIFRSVTNSIIETGYERVARGEPVSIVPPVNWYPSDRSAAYHLNALEPVTFLLRAFCIYKERRYFDTAFEFCRDWLRTFLPGALLIGHNEDALSKQFGPSAWYDMGVGLRSYRLAYILDYISRDELYTNEDVRLFLDGLIFHLELLRDDDFFRSHNNHGLYQALGYQAASQRFKELDYFQRNFEIARQKTLQMLKQQFHESGIHREHSPGYHYIIMGSFISARESGLIKDQETLESIDRIEAAMTWLVQPNNEILSFGDTDRRDSSSGQRYASRFKNTQLQYLLSGAQFGEAPGFGIKAFEDAGYVFARLNGGEKSSSYKDASYLAQTAAFHSRVHKHADHLSFIWHDRNRDILIDPGRYAYAGRTETGSDLFNQGFWYADPKRIYCESTRAHNCVEIDSKSYPRRSVKPFGSALRYAGEQNGLAVTDCEVTHLRSVRHRRVIVMAPRHFLLVLDWLNDRTAEHDFRQWFQFAPEWIVAPSPNGLVATVPSQEAGVQTGALDPSGVFLETPGTPAAPPEKLSIVNLIDENAFAAPVCGQTEPELQGWMSDAAYSLVPSTSICVEALGRQMGRFATLFCFGEASVDRAATRFNTTLRAGTVRWRDGGGEHKLALSLGEPGSASAKLTSS